MEKTLGHKFLSLDALPGPYYVSTFGNVHVLFDAGIVTSSGMSCYDVEDFLIKKMTNLSQTMIDGSYCQTAPHVSIWQITVSPTTTTLSSRCVEY